MTKWIFTVFAFSTFSLSCLCAQNSGTTFTPPTSAQIVADRIARLTTLLTLTASQQSTATTIFTTAETTLSGLSTGMQTARAALQTAVRKNDTAGITTQATQIGSLTTQEVEAQSKAEADFIAILTAEQQTKYEQLQSYGPGGPGGPGGPVGFGGPGGHGPASLGAQ